MTLEDYPKSIIIKDGTEVLLRPLRREDETRLLEFFKHIPEHERWFLRHNVSDPGVVHRWVENLDYERVLPLVALRESDQRIIANMSLHRPPFGALRHVGRLRIVVDPEYRSQRLGTWMLLDIVRLAMDAGIEKLVARFVESVEQAAINAAYKMDFFKVATLPEYAKDRNGRYHDVIVMIKTLHREWSDF
jgi:L-amino acid N-acyltransferase YncA